MVNRVHAWWRRYVNSSPQSPSVLNVYRQWQQRFLHQRLRLLIWLLLFVVVSFTLFELWVLFAMPERDQTTDFVTDGIIGSVFAIATSRSALLVRIVCPNADVTRDWNH